MLFFTSSIGDYAFFVSLSFSSHQTFLYLLYVCDDNSVPVCQAANVFGFHSVNQNLLPHILFLWLVLGKWSLWYLGLLFLDMVTVPLPIFSSIVSQGKWKKSSSCPCSYCKGEEANSGLWLHLPQAEAPFCSNSCCCKACKWGWQRESRGNVKRCSPQVCFPGMFHSELVYFLYLFD